MPAPTGQDSCRRADRIVDAGQTNLQLMLTTGWQPHSVRGAISGLLRKRLGLNVVLTRNAAGERVYRIG